MLFILFTHSKTCLFSNIRFRDKLQEICPIIHKAPITELTEAVPSRVQVLQ